MERDGQRWFELEADCRRRHGSIATRLYGDLSRARSRVAFQNPFTAGRAWPSEVIDPPPYKMQQHRAGASPVERPVLYELQFRCDGGYDAWGRVRA